MMQLSEAGLRANREYFENIERKYRFMWDKARLNEFKAHQLLSNLASSSNTAPAADE